MLRYVIHVSHDLTICYRIIIRWRQEKDTFTQFSSTTALLRFFFFQRIFFPEQFLSNSFYESLYFAPIFFHDSAVFSYLEFLRYHPKYVIPVLTLCSRSSRKIEVKRLQNGLIPRFWQYSRESNLNRVRRRNWFENRLTLNHSAPVLRTALNRIETRWNRLNK